MSTIIDVNDYEYDKIDYEDNDDEVQLYSFMKLKILQQIAVIKFAEVERICTISF